MQRDNTSRTDAGSIETKLPGGTASRRRFLALSAVVGAGAVGAAGATGATDQGDDPEATVSFADHTTNGTWVNVESATLSDGGFVAIHDSSLLDGEVFGSVVGVSEPLEAGDHEGVVVHLFTDVPGQEFDGEMAEDGETLIAMPHLDSNGNGEYDFITSEGEEDGPYVDENGEPVVADAAISVDDGMDDGEMESGDGEGTDDEEGTNDEETGEDGEMATASVHFEDQQGDGTRVAVAEASLSDGGFVAIHDSSLLDGEVFGSVVGVSDALDAGEHSDVEVHLFEGVPGQEFDRESADDGETLIAMPHFDSNENGEYDFITSDGEEDGAYVDENGEPIVDDASLRIC